MACVLQVHKLKSNHFTVQVCLCHFCLKLSRSCTQTLLQYYNIYVHLTQMRLFNSIYLMNLHRVALHTNNVIYTVTLPLAWLSQLH